MIKTGEEVKGEKETGKRIGLFNIGAATGITQSAWAETHAFETEKQSGKLDASLGNFDTNASVTGGMGVYLPGKDGKNQLYYGIEGQVGASVSAIEVDGSMEYELCDFVTVGAETNVTVGEAKLEAASSIGIIDGQVELNASASAELNLVSADVQGKVDMGIVEGKVGGSVSFGVGAHADVGIKDNVLKFDVGVAAGLGCSVNAEIDFSGTIDAVGDAWNYTANAVSEGWDTFIGFLS